MVINIFIFVAVFFILALLIGKLIEKWKIPWIFSALLIGCILSIKNPFTSITSSPEFSFLSQLGMLFLLFVIGFEIDLKKLKKIAGFIVGATFFIILVEALVGTLIIHYLFGYAWLISFIVGISFATVGEGILIPILEEFKLVNTKLGQTLLGIGTFDDIFEITILIVTIILLGTKYQTASVQSNILIPLIALGVLFILTAIFLKIPKKKERFKFSNIETIFLFSLAVLFVFLGIGEFANSAALAAFLAGISLKTFLPKERLENIESEMKSLCYGFFAPIFFLSVGLAMNINYLFYSPLLILIVFFASGLSKLIASYIMGAKQLGKKRSIILGIGLSVRFSTSLVIIKILLDNSLIRERLYTIIVASSILFTLIIPILFSKLVSRLKEAKKKDAK